MVIDMKCVVFFVATAVVASASTYASKVSLPITAGWENSNPDRKEFPATEAVWKAPANGFKVEMSGGAQGDVSLRAGEIRIRKKNNGGRITVTAPEARFKSGQVLRFIADVEVKSSNPDEAKGWLSAAERGKTFKCDNNTGRKRLGSGGLRKSLMVNSVPGTPYRKYNHVLAAKGRLIPAIVVEGDASESVWRGWMAEDVDVAEVAWKRHLEKVRVPDRASEMMPDDAFSKELASDIEHTAEIRTVDGRSVLYVDGKPSVPVVYREGSMFHPPEDAVTYAGGPLVAKGVKIGIVNLSFHQYWSKSGFRAADAVERIRKGMRASNGAVMILGLKANVYPEFTQEHPDEVWIKADGSVVRGNMGSCCLNYSTTGEFNSTNTWPWISYASKVWQQAVKDAISQLFAELKRQNMTKRIVGVHFTGYHDGQFALPFEDHSPSAKAEYRRFIAEGNPEGGYKYFCKQLGFRAQEEFVRHTKKLLGKPVLGVRWCMMPFGGDNASSYDIGSFVRSDAIDVIVPQPTYPQRPPALAQGPRLPCATFHDNRKMMWYEFDLRTYAAFTTWGNSIASAKGGGLCEDDIMWRTVFRKHAGIMTALGMGWWFYDMSGGWFRPEPIANDIGEVVQFRGDLMKTPPSSWRPDAVIVVNEREMALYNTPGMKKVKNMKSLVMKQWPRTASAGVPYEVRLAEDFVKRPELAKRYKAAVLAAFLSPDDTGCKAMDAFKAAGVKTYVVPDGGYSAEFFNSFVADAGGYVATRPGLQVDMSGDFLSVHCIVPGVYEFNRPFECRVVNAKSGKDEAVKDGKFILNMTAGETCWFRFVR